jgi:uncharacterized protein YaaQ
MRSLESNDLRALIGVAQRKFADLLSSYLKDGVATREQYCRYLSFQYHLTKDVQRYFLSVAAHSDLARRRKLRAFLVNFTNEEELHYLVAANDLDRLEHAPLTMPFDVELWHAYFRSVVETRPFIRLGAAVILENISAGVARPLVQQALRGDFLTRENTKFLVLHQHETLPHGDQILEAIEEAGLEHRQMADLLEGARKGTVLYCRMAEWAMGPETLAALCDRGRVELDLTEQERIRNFRMTELA